MKIRMKPLSISYDAVIFCLFGY